MRLNFTLKKLAATLLVAGLTLVAPAQAASTHPVYGSAEDAATALAEGVRAQDAKAILAVVGRGAQSWLFSGDAVADRTDWERFLAAYDRKHAIAMKPDGSAILTIGEDEWPFPIPLLKKGNGWKFDTAKGREEVANRRVGQNELDTIQTLLAIVDAQHEYAVGDPDGNGFNDYAQRFRSSEGQKDGLYWPTAPNEPASPLGPLVVKAAQEGYGKSNAGAGKMKSPGAVTAPYHGYHFRILKAQGKHAQGGQYDYLVRGKLLGGFAVVAYPAKYGVSGVMTFAVNHEGVVYQKNLGAESAALASKMTRFNPDAAWSKAE
jgi:hypothetical protein